MHVNQPASYKENRECMDLIRDKVVLEGLIPGSLFHSTFNYRGDFTKLKLLTSLG